MIAKKAKILLITIATMFMVIIIPIILPQTTKAQVEVEVQTGSTFKDEDARNAENCTIPVLRNKFPFDFLAGNIQNGSGCPNIELFGYNNEMCWIIDIWLKIEPAFVTSLLIYGIFNW